MPKKQRPSFQKRQKEMARQQKQREKEARRAERKQLREAGIVEEEHLEVLTAPQPLTDDIPPPANAEDTDDKG